MAGLVPAIHDFPPSQNVDARDPSPPRLRRGRGLARLAGALAKAASPGMTTSLTAFPASGTQIAKTTPCKVEWSPAACAALGYSSTKVTVSATFSREVR